MAPGLEESHGRLALQDMPEEILEAILCRLHAPQLSQVRLTCKRLAAVGKRPHLPPRQEQLRLALNALTRSGNELVMPGWGNSWGVRPTTGPGRRKLLLRLPPQLLTGTLRHMVALDIENCGQVFELVLSRLRGSTALRALRLVNINLTETRAAALRAAGILSGLQRLELKDMMANPFSDGCWRMLGSPGLEGLRSLTLAANLSSFESPPDATIARLKHLRSLSLQVVAWETFGIGPSNRSRLLELLGALRPLTGLTSLELEVEGWPLREREAMPQHRAALVALTGSLTNPTHLGLAELDLSLDALLDLAAGTTTTSLTSLDLREKGLDLASAWRLAESAPCALRQLRALRLGGKNHSIFVESPQVLAHASEGRVTTSLKLFRCRTGDVLNLQEGLTSLHLEGQDASTTSIEYAAQLRDVGSLRRLTALHLDSIKVGGGPHLGHLAAGSRLTSLHLHRCHMANADFAVLAGSRGFSSLKSLSVRALFRRGQADASPIEPFSASAAMQLTASPWLRGLENLTLRSAGIGHEAAAVLAATGGGLPRLTSLNLSECSIGDEGARALAESQTLRALAHLHVGYSGVTDVGIKYFARSTSLVSLKEVWLEQTPVGRKVTRSQEYLSFMFSRSWNRRWAAPFDSC